MSKRFTDNEIWRKQRWFKKLHPFDKLAFFYIKDECHYSGIWKIDCLDLIEDLGLDDFDLQKFVASINTDYNKVTGKKTIKERIRIIDKNLLWVTGFLQYQYENKAGFINLKAGAVMSAIDYLKKLGLYEEAVEKKYIVFFSDKSEEVKSDNLDETTEILGEGSKRVNGGSAKSEGRVPEKDGEGLHKIGGGSKRVGGGSAESEGRVLEKEGEGLHEIRGGSKRVNGESERVRERERERERERDKEKERGVEKFEKEFLIPEMFAVFQKKMPDYPGSVDMDFKPLNKIAIFISDQSKLNGNHVENKGIIIKKWEQLSSTIADDGFYKMKSLSVISNQIQEIFQMQKNGGTATNKSSQNPAKPAGGKVVYGIKP